MSKSQKMRAYSIDELLLGTWYRSPNSYKEGEINFVYGKRDDVWVGDNATAYVVRYRETNTHTYHNATIAVVTGDN